MRRHLRPREGDEAGTGRARRVRAVDVIVVARRLWPSSEVLQEMARTAAVGKALLYVAPCSGYTPSCGEGHPVSAHDNLYCSGYTPACGEHLDPVAHAATTLS